MQATYRIAYNRFDHDYTCYVTIDDVEQTIGSRPNHVAAEALCREYLYDHFTDTNTPEVAAQIAVEMSETESLTTAIYLDGSDTIITHATPAERDYYLRCNRRARIIDTPCFEETGAPDADELREWAKEDETPVETELPNGWMRMPEGDIFDTNGMRVNWSSTPIVAVEMSETPTLPGAIALTLTGTADPTCELCDAPAFVSCGGHLYCKAQWQQGACESCPACQGAHRIQRCPVIGALLLADTLEIPSQARAGVLWAV